MSERVRERDREGQGQRQTGREKQGVSECKREQVRVCERVEGEWEVEGGVLW